MFFPLNPVELLQQTVSLGKKCIISVSFMKFRSDGDSLLLPFLIPISAVKLEDVNACSASPDLVCGYLCITSIGKKITKQIINSSRSSKVFRLMQIRYHWQTGCSVAVQLHDQALDFLLCLSSILPCRSPLWASVEAVEHPSHETEFLSQADSFLNAEPRNANWFMHKGVSRSSDSPKFPR